MGAHMNSHSWKPTIAVSSSDSRGIHQRARSRRNSTFSAARGAGCTSATRYIASVASTRQAKTTSAEELMRAENRKIAPKHTDASNETSTPRGDDCCDDTAVLPVFPGLTATQPCIQFIADDGGVRRGQGAPHGVTEPGGPSIGENRTDRSHQGG